MPCLPCSGPCCSCPHAFSGIEVVRWVEPDEGRALVLCRAPAIPNDGALMRIRRAAAEDIEELSALVMSAKAHWGYMQAQLQAWRSSLEVSADSVSARPTF